MSEDLLNVVRYGWGNLSQEEEPTDGSGVRAGHLLEETSNGVQPHQTDGGAVSRVLVAKDMRGRGFEAGDTYDDNEFITVLIGNEGVGLTMLLAGGSNLATASNADITDGDELVSAGNGTLRKFDSGAGDTEADIVAVAEESNDNSGSSDAVLFDVEVTR